MIAPTDKIFDSLESFLDLLKSWRTDQSKIAFTNGCFDILHKGHSQYLYQSALQADRLIVGLNTDLSVSKIKGPMKPICDQSSRAHLLASMYFVDAVVLFGEETPIKLIESIMPDVLVKGADYDIDNMIGGGYVIENGGRTMTIPLSQGYSTSNIIKMIKGQHEA